MIKWKMKEMQQKKSQKPPSNKLHHLKFQTYRGLRVMFYCRLLILIDLFIYILFILVHKV